MATSNTNTISEPCTLLMREDELGTPNITSLKKQMESNQDDQKILALEATINYLLQGEKLPQLLMTIIRFVLPSKNHTIKKLLLIYWECIDKHDETGKLKSEMILVCNALRNDLIHPNEYVRGSTLRYLCKLKEPELLEPLIPSIVQNLEHRHSYVRKNTISALHSIFSNFPNLCPDAPELVFKALLNEGDAACKRNAFIMLFNCDQSKALEFLNGVLESVPNFGDILQIVTIELLRKVCRTKITPVERSRYIRCIISLLSSQYPGVQLEAATALYSLSPTPTAIKAAASTFIHLLCEESDNNVKLVILDKLQEIKKKHSQVLEGLLMDVLRALNTPALSIKQKTLDFAMNLVNPRNIEEVILLLKKEIAKTHSATLDKAAEYRQMLVQAIHSCAVKFPDVAGKVVLVLMDFLSDSSVASAVDVVVFVREVVETYADLRKEIIRKLLDSLYTIKSSKVFRSALWIIGEYSESIEEIDAAFTTIKEALGATPFIPALDGEEETEEQPATTKTSAPNKVLADGTYASQSAYVDSSKPKEEIPTMRNLLLNSDFFLGTVIATTLAKLFLRLYATNTAAIIKNSVQAESLLIITCILRLGKSGVVPIAIDPDSEYQINVCMQVLLNPTNPTFAKLLLEQTRKAFTETLQELKAIRPENEPKEVSVQADDLITFRLLRPKRGDLGGEEDEFELDLTRATGFTDDSTGNDLNRIYQLTGFSDPLYAEAYVNVHRYDIVLDVLVKNRTRDTLQNVCLELATLGDLKLCERPHNKTIGPKSETWLQANIKVSSTETGIIFGNLVYDIAGRGASDKNCVVLNDLHIDIMDYIAPASTTELSYRVMWAEFEWENKVVINSNISDLNEFLEHIVSSTNMKCLTPPSALKGDCGFLAANLYAKSIFGEDALANVSVEQIGNRVTGYIRIRSKTQGIALSLGEKITLKQARKK